MKKFQFKFSILISIIFLSLESNSSAYYSYSSDECNELLQLDYQIEHRWKKIEQIKDSCIPYSQKSVQEITNEFQYLYSFRRYLWYANPGQSPIKSNKDYKIASHLLNRSFYPHSLQLMAFNYNCIGDSYNASSILLYGLHFIALEEPSTKTQYAFFKLLMNQKVSILVRLKPEGEYLDRGSINYWENRIEEGPSYSMIQLANEYPSSHDKILIPYFYINVWSDRKGVEVSALYDLVQKVRLVYSEKEMKGPIACHCSAGAGRTGTFIAAYTLAYLLDILEPHEISIEEVVLKLSIQRSGTIANPEQYLLLYQFVEYYLMMKNQSLQKFH